VEAIDVEACPDIDEFGRAGLRKTMIGRNLDF
jgi:hypothetical protein